MPLSKEQVSALLGMVASTKSDDIDCDGCFSHLAEFAELKLTGRSLPDALSAIERHLDQCSCCKDEFEALMDGLRATQQD